MDEGLDIKQRLERAFRQPLRAEAACRLSDDRRLLQLAGDVLREVTDYVGFQSLGMTDAH